MSTWSDGRIGLEEYLTGLQAALSKSREQAELDKLMFGVDGVTVEVDVSYTIGQRAGSSTTAGPEFWVLGTAAQGAKEAGGVSDRNTQRLVVRLTQRPADPELDASAEVAATSSPPRPSLPDIAKMLEERQQKQVT